MSKNPIATKVTEEVLKNLVQELHGDSKQYILKSTEESKNETFNFKGSRILVGRKHVRKLTSLLYVTMSGIGAYGGISYIKQDEKFHRNILMPLVHLIEPEQAHKLGVFVHKHRLIPKTTYQDPDTLKITLFGQKFTNPVGIAAGFDKDGEAILGLQDIGFGFIEVGSVTPEPQFGNEKPRVFRLKQDKAVINRYGFNNEGHAVVLERISKLRSTNKCDAIIGVNLGKNKLSSNAIDDYVVGIERFAPVANYLVINISSPNTPGLRSMQNKVVLKQLLTAILAARNNLPENKKPPILLKLAPDLSLAERKDIAEVILLKECKIDGLIVSNTTLDRPQFLVEKEISCQNGGLSGKPLRDSSTEIVSDMYKLTNGKVPIIGVGGIFTGEDAYQKIKAGASIIQIYTSLVYEGPPVVKKIKSELHDLIIKDGYKNVSEAIGKDVKFT